MVRAATSLNQTAPLPVLAIDAEDAKNRSFNSGPQSGGLPAWWRGVRVRAIGATGASLAAAGYGVPRPDPTRVVTPDHSLPAFERILSLLSGGIKARTGKTNHLSADDTAAALMRIFREEGLLVEVAL